jgi:hypothetical protein
MRKESIVSIFFDKRTRLLACCLFVLLPLTISAQRVLTLDSCRQLAINNNKQLSVARSQKEMASYNVKSAKTKYLPHVDAMAGYELMSKEVSILNNSQKDALNHLGTNAVTGVGARVTDIITTMVQDGTITPQMGQRLGQQMGVLSSSLATMGATGYRLTALVATGFCLLGGLVFMRYRERRVLETIGATKE